MQTWRELEEKYYNAKTYVTILLRTAVREEGTMFSVSAKKLNSLPLQTKKEQHGINAEVKEPERRIKEEYTTCKINVKKYGL